MSISIIVSSYIPDLFNQFKMNVEKTIGIPHEIIQIWNPNKMGICEAYNKGAKQAKYNYLVFAHEDILFHNESWGKELIKTFESDNNIGLVGVIGSNYKAAILSGWANYKDNHSSNLISNFDNLVFYNKIRSGVKLNKTLLCAYEDILKFQPIETEYEEVTCLDGLFLTTKKNIFNEFQFDEFTFKNFHCYDVDYSLQINQKYKAVVSYNIFITHFSSGSFNKQWVKDSLALHKKWNKLLPYSNKDLSKEQIIKSEKNTYILLTHTIRKNKSFYYLLITELLKIQLIKKLNLINYAKLIHEISKHSLQFINKK